MIVICMNFLSVYKYTMLSIAYIGADGQTAANLTQIVASSFGFSFSNLFALFIYFFMAIWKIVQNQAETHVSCGSCCCHVEHGQECQVGNSFAVRRSQMLQFSLLWRFQGFCNDPQNNMRMKKKKGEKPQKKKQENCENVKSKNHHS